MSQWNQWFTPAPMMIIERPCVFSALAANSRATTIARSRGTPVIASCHAGVYGTFAS